MLEIKDVLDYLEELFPRKLAYEWDNVGLQIGDPNNVVGKILLALDATKATIDEATHKEFVDLFITHHPFFFSPVKSIDITTPQGANIDKIIKSDLTIYTLHTNFDVAPGGMNDTLAETIGLQNVMPFAMIDEDHGLGRMGELEKEMSLEEGINHIKQVLNLEDVRYVQGNVHPIKKIAIVGGSGGKYIHEVKALGADLFITGDVTHHTAVDAQEIGLNVIDIGHYAETIMLEKLATLLTEKFGEEELTVIVSNVSKNPIQLGN